MRLPALALCLATLIACGGHGDRGPAWPQRADREVDGGESLSPRATSVIAATSEDDDDDEKVAAKPAEKPAAAATAPDKPAAATVTPPTTIVAPEEVINIDDIVIEIDD